MVLSHLLDLEVGGDKGQKVGKESAPGGPISNLKSVVRHSITNKGTQNVMKDAYMDLVYLRTISSI